MHLCHMDKRVKRSHDGAGISLLHYDPRSTRLAAIKKTRSKERAFLDMYLSLIIQRRRVGHAFKYRIEIIVAIAAFPILYILNTETHDLRRFTTALGPRFGALEGSDLRERCGGAISTG